MGVPFGQRTPFNPLTDYDWYVDSVNGDDGNDGTTAADAFQTIAKLQTVLAEGERVGLVRGSHWREQLGSSPGTAGTGTDIPAGCEFYAVGSGTLPILDSSDIIDMTEASLVEGTTNTWEIDVTTVAAASSDLFCTLFRTPSGGDLLEDSRRLLRVSSAAGTHDEAGTYHIGLAITSTGPHTLTFTPPGSELPTASGVVYEITRRATAFSGSAAGALRVDGLICRRAMWSNGCFVLDQDNGHVVKRVLTNDGVRHCHFQPGGTKSQCVAFGAPDVSAITGGDGMGFTSFRSTSGGEFTETNCVVINLDPTTNCVGFFCHGSVTDAFTKATMRGCKTVGVRTAFNHVDTLEVDIDGLAISGSNQADGVGQCRAALGTLRNVRIYGEDPDLVAATQVILFRVPVAGGTWLIDNSFIGTSREASKNGIVHDQGLLTLTLTNTALAATGSKTSGGPWLAQSNGTAGSTVKYNNCLFVTTATGTIGGMMTLANSDIDDESDDNHFSKDEIKVSKAGVESTTVTAHQAANAPIDANSVIGAVTITDDSAEKRELAGMVRFSGHNGKGPDMSGWNEELDPDVLLAEALAL